MNKTDKIFNFIKDNPGLMQYQIAKKMGYKQSKNISSPIFQLKGEGSIKQGDGGYIATSDERQLELSLYERIRRS